METWEMPTFSIQGRDKLAILEWLSHEETYEKAHVFIDEHGKSHYVGQSIDVELWFPIEQARRIYASLSTFYEEHYWEVLEVGDRGAVLLYAQGVGVLGIYEKRRLRSVILGLSKQCRETAWSVYNLVMELSNGP